MMQICVLPFSEWPTQRLKWKGKTWFTLGVGYWIELYEFTNIQTLLTYKYDNLIRFNQPVIRSLSALILVSRNLRLLRNYLSLEKQFGNI